MARARNIKPGFYKNEDLAECSIWARYIFPGLWMLADREGRMEDRPKRIKGELLPFDSQDVEPLLAELASKRDGRGIPFIVRYVSNGVAYIQIMAFKRHQNPHHREPPSTIPAIESLGLSHRATQPKPEAQAPLNAAEAQGKPEAKPGQDPPKDDLARGSSRADSLIPDSLIPEVPTPDGVGVPGAKAAPDDAGDDSEQQPDNCPHTEIIALYHRELPMLAEVREWGETRKKYLRTRWREKPERQSIDWWRDFFRYVAKCPFLVGKGKVAPDREPFLADLEWLVRPTNFVKVIEGKYEPRALRGNGVGAAAHV